MSDLDQRAGALVQAVRETVAALDARAAEIWLDPSEAHLLCNLRRMLAEWDSFASDGETQP